MKNAWKVIAFGAGLMSALAASAARADDDGPWEVRLRAVYLDPANKSDAYAPLAIPGNAIHINDKVVPDLDFEYFFTPHWSSELLLTYPQSQTVTVEHSALGGPTVIGTFKHLPPTLTAKYDFLPNSAFQPYVGAGINLTIISDVHLAVPTVGPLTLDHTSVGPAAQAGFDYKVANHWYLNADVKWVMLRSDVKFDGTRISEARIDPWLIGVGIGYRFGGSRPQAPAPMAATAPPPPPPAAEPSPPAAPAPAPPAAPRHVTFNADALFAFNSADLQPQGAQRLDKFAAELSGTTYDRIHVIGYSDRFGSATYNLRLSRQRADSVKNYLVEKGGLDAGKIEAEGRGKAEPVTKPGECGAKQSPATIACLQPDRRVEIEVSGTQHSN